MKWTVTGDAISVASKRAYHYCKLCRAVTWAWRYTRYENYLQCLPGRCPACALATGALQRRSRIAEAGSAHLPFLHVAALHSRPRLAAHRQPGHQPPRHCSYPARIAPRLSPPPAAADTAARLLCNRRWCRLRPAAASRSGACAAATGNRGTLACRSAGHVGGAASR